MEVVCLPLRVLFLSCRSLNFFCFTPLPFTNQFQRVCLSFCPFSPPQSCVSLEAALQMSILFSPLPGIHALVSLFSFFLLFHSLWLKMDLVLPEGNSDQLRALLAAPVPSPLWGFLSPLCLPAELCGGAGVSGWEAPAGGAGIALSPLAASLLCTLVWCSFAFPLAARFLEDILRGEGDPWQPPSFSAAQVYSQFSSYWNLYLVSSVLRSTVFIRQHLCSASTFYTDGTFTWADGGGGVLSHLGALSAGDQCKF